MCEEDFELDPVWDQAPVDVLEDGGGVIAGTGVGAEFWMYWSLLPPFDALTIEITTETLSWSVSSPRQV